MSDAPTPIHGGAQRRIRPTPIAMAALRWRAIAPSMVTAEDVGGRRLRVSLPGAGVVRISGRVTRLDVTLAGSGQVDLSALVARDVHALLFGLGRIVVDATHRLDAHVPGSGVVVYLGDPARVTTRVTGSGAVMPG
jgi:hypothetical protein